MDLSNPLSVTSPEGMHLSVMNSDDQVPASFLLSATHVGKKVAIRIAGGCKGMSPEEKLDMLDYFSQAFKGYAGLIMSGATRQLTPDGQTDPMVTDIPGLIVQENPNCRALGTAPRTDIMRFKGESVLNLDKHGTLINPTYDNALIVQKDPGDNLDWDGDVQVYLKMLDDLVYYAGFKGCGLVVWNGGEVTRKEATLMAEKRRTVILVKGSGRVADELALDQTFLDYSDVYVASKDDYSTLRNILIRLNFLD